MPSWGVEADRYVGIILPNYGPALDAATLVAATQAAEASGFELSLGHGPRRSLREGSVGLRQDLGGAGHDGGPPRQDVTTSNRRVGAHYPAA